MTVPEDDDRPVLDILGFGAPGTLPVRASARVERETPPEITATTAIEAADAAPLTRRERRERERALEPAVPAPRRGFANRDTKARPATDRPTKTRSAKSAMRRDAVRTAGRTGSTIGKRLLSFGAALFAGALALGMSVPANAFVDWTSGSSSQKLDLAQSFTMEGQSIEVDPTLVSFSERDGWTVTSWAEMLRLRYGNRSFDYTIGSGPIRWPFPFAVPISSGFGDRAAPCRGCSTAHSGIDFNPGYGAAIFAIADGTVVDVSSGGSSWGHYVVIEHQIDGQTVFSGYAHMVSASSPLVVGEQVKVGDFVGLTGATGQATGAHLHFTIAIGERMHYVDPFTFLKQYAS